METRLLNSKPVVQFLLSSAVIETKIVAIKYG